MSKLLELLKELKVDIYINNPDCPCCKGKGWIDGEQCKECIEWRNHE